MAPPFPIGRDTLFIAFYASAELSCFKALGWPMPANVLDLFVEFRNRANGLTPPAGFSLIGALAYFGLDSIGATEKDDMRALILGGGPWSDGERAAISEYCAGDVAALERLLPAMLPQIDQPRAILRGRYMKAAAAMEWNGVPIDTNTLALLRAKWTEIQDQLISDIDADYGVFDGRTFKAERWEQYLVAHGIPWPRLESGRLDLSDGAFRQMAKAHPRVRCTSCAVRYPIFVSMISKLARTGAIERFCRHSAPAPAATSRAARNIFSARQSGCDP